MGYVDPNEKSKEDTTTKKKSIVLRPLAPNDKPRSTPDVLQVLREMLPGTSFKDDLEWRYFKHFCDNLAVDLSGPFKTDLWARYIPQTGEIEPFVRNAIIALGALSLGQNEDPEDEEEHNEQQVVSRHEAYATSKYVKVLEDMRTALAEDPDSRQALMACLLVFCFESMRGHQYSAAVHAAGGLALVDRLRPDSQTASNTIGEGSEKIDWKDGIGHDLYSAYAGLDVQALLMIDTRTTAEHQRYKERMTPAIDRMPNSFNNTQEALQFWRLLFRRNSHFIAIARAEVQAYQISQQSLQAGEITKDDETKLLPGNNCWSRNGSIEQLPSHHPLWLEQAQNLLDIDRFEEAANKLFTRHATPTSSQDHDFFTASVIRIQMELNKIGMAYSFGLRRQAWDAYLPTFRRILALTQPILPYIRSPHSAQRHKDKLIYRIDIGILAALSMTTNLCREKQERQLAIKLFEALGEYREGIWDLKPAYGIAKWVLAHEEPWRDVNGYIPPERRIDFEGAEVNIRGRRMVVRGWQGDGTETKQVKRENLVTW